ncbi:energy transducer TonB [Thiocystis violascens]|uniref:Protein TonB n=1 Tax=Thiocystis violascens (strain ATCC 17096 / DSM 198 / 6111) TaxID=765911 RepID=I3Y873_THIV6|nr:energy transducer TonB [Thiocystis violascens]AFL73191.1 TonB family protein [Thiocystis violascens DSM 198]
MKDVRGCLRCVWLGLLFSAFMHAAIAAALLRVDAPASTASAERVVSLDLALFGAGEASESTGPMAMPVPETALAAPTPAPLQEQPREPEPEPEPAINQDDRPLSVVGPEVRSAPEPAIPPLPVQPPAPDGRIAAKTARLEPKTKAPSPPQTSVKPKPKPASVAKSKPKTKSKPTVKPSATAQKTAPTTAAAPSGTSRNPRPDAGAASGTRKATQPSGSGGESASAVRDRSEQEYLSALQQAIKRHQNYPMEARRRQQTGIATVAFVIRPDGRIDQIRLAKGSGQSALDRAALDALRRLGRFKPIPTSLGRSSWPLRVPIRFDLK